ncbi:MAG: HlyC/CorC family transporter [Planctomycetaceae bacterium]|nr:HlyC/CorC family transporter [Planctomycetaceae bacterium]
MSPKVLSVLAGLFFTVAFGATLVTYSLRMFSRGRLAELCRKKENETRFGVILKEDIRVLTAWESVQLTSLVIGLIALILVIGPPINESSNWLLLAAGLSLGAILAFVAIPWSLSRVASESILYASWPLLYGVARLMHPIVIATNAIDTLVHRMAGRQDPVPENATSIHEEIQSVVDEGHREGLLETRASHMIQRVMELQEEDVRAVMTPRTEMLCIQKDVSLDQARQLLLEAGHSRVPVIGDSTDDIVGILYAKDLLRYLVSDNDTATLSDIIREPLYVPETTGIDLLLERMKRERFHICIALDEYGGVVGLVTLEDILEEIVGEIVDEFDQAEEEPIQQIDDRTTIVDARVHVDDLNEQFGFGLPENDDFDTIGGFVFSQLGHVPDKNESLTWGPIRITVLEADQRRVIQVRIEVDETLVSASDEH